MLSKHGSAAANNRLPSHVRSSVEPHRSRPAARVQTSNGPHLHAWPHVAQRVRAYVQRALGAINVHAVGAALAAGAHCLRPAAAAAAAPSAAAAAARAQPAAQGGRRRGQQAWQEAAGGGLQRRPREQAGTRTAAARAHRGEDIFGRVLSCVPRLDGIAADVQHHRVHLICAAAGRQAGGRPWSERAGGAGVKPAPAAASRLPPPAMAAGDGGRRPHGAPPPYTAEPDIRPPGLGRPPAAAQTPSCWGEASGTLVSCWMGGGGWAAIDAARDQGVGRAGTEMGAVTASWTSVRRLSCAFGRCVYLAILSTSPQCKSGVSQAQKPLPALLPSATMHGRPRQKAGPPDPERTKAAAQKASIPGC